MAKDVRAGLDGAVLDFGDEFGQKSEQDIAEAAEAAETVQAQKALAYLRQTLLQDRPRGRTVSFDWINLRVQGGMRQRGEDVLDDKTLNSIWSRWIGARDRRFKIDDVWKLWDDTRENPPSMSGNLEE